MKKIIVLISIFSLLAGLCACGASEGTTAQNSVPEASSPEAASSSGTAAKASSEPGSAPESSAADIPDDRFCFVYQGILIGMSDPAQPVTEALGEPLSYTEFDSCAGLGIEKYYIYSDFELRTYQAAGKGEDRINSVYFTSDVCETAEGLCLGMSLEEALALYPAEYDGSVPQIIVTKGNCDLFITFADGAVFSIEYMANDNL